MRGSSSTANPEVRVIVHTGEGRAFQTGVDVAEIAGDGVGMERYRQSVEDWDLHFTAWHQQVWKPVITAVNGICAGGGFHWVADADIVIAASDAQFFDPHVSVGQVVALEAIGLIRKMPVEAVMRMAFVGRYERMSAQRALRARDDQPDRRPARAAPRGGAGAGREDRQELAGRDGGHQAGALGRARARADRRVPGRRGRARPACGATPTRRRDRRVRREARPPTGSRSSRDARVTP